MLGGNALESFLREPYWETLAPELGSDLAARLSPLNLRSLAERAVGALQQSDAPALAWAELRAVLSDQIVYPDLWPSLRNGILITNFARLTLEVRRIGVLALSTSCFQAANVDDPELRVYLVKQLISVSAALAGNGSAPTTATDDEDRDLLWNLFEAALNLSIGPSSDIPDVVREFSRVVTGVLDVWPPSAAILRPAITRLCEELPPRTTRELWPLLVRIRAGSTS
jgi:hypothetical protein